MKIRMQSDLCLDLPVWSGPRCIEALVVVEWSRYSGRQTLKNNAAALMKLHLRFILFEIKQHRRQMK